MADGDSPHLKELKDIFGEEGRDPARIPRILALLEEYWSEHPDLRLGQLLSIAASDHAGRDTFELEDEDFEMWLEAALEESDDK